MSDSKFVRGSAQSEDLTQAQSVLMRLRELILGGAFTPGIKLKAASLAEKLGVSRTPIRNALAVLESEGLVEYSNRRGYTAIEIGVQDFLDATDVRACLEATAAQILAQKGISDETGRYLSSQAAIGRAIVDNGIWDKEVESSWYASNYNFHRSLVRETKNRYLINAITITLVVPVIGDSFPLASIGSEVNNSTQVPKHINESQDQHERLIVAILERDAIRAHRIMYEHVTLTKDRVKASTSRKPR